MEKKISRRIVGSLVVVALVIILLPLFSNNDGAPLIQSAAIEKPTFPVSPAETVALVENENSTIPESAAHKKIKDIMTPDKNLPGMSSAANNNQHAAPALSVASNSAEPLNPKIVKVIPAASTQQVKPEVKAVVAENSKAVDSKHHDAATKNKIDIASLKNPAWVVQLGSFKNKNNAARLTNALRSKGYKAFTYETKSNNQVRVYVGPEFQQVAAASLATKIEKDMQMQGVVLSYKPLEI